jgi:hypothetical protein
MTSDLTFALEQAKYAARSVYGVRRNVPKEEEFLRLLNKFMILNVLSDVNCLEELTDTEIASLTGILILHT